MTEKREFYAASIDEAVEKAASQLGVAAADLDYTVVDEGNAGFLGIGARDARVQVEGPPAANDETVIESDVEEPIVEMPPAQAEPPAEEEPQPPLRSEVPEVFADDTEDGHEEVPQEVLDDVTELVTTLLDAMGFEARTDVYDAGGFVAVDVSSDNTALFIGQKGETIDALQYLVNASVNKGRSSRARVVLDAEGYRQRRVEAIQGMAHRTARRAVRERRTVELPPMNPAERRVVHLFLRDNPGVVTNSQGTGDDRRVHVSPA